MSLDTPPLQSIAATPAVDCTPPLQPIAPKPSVNHHETSKNHQKKSADRSAPVMPPPEGVDEQTWTDWLQLRKSLKAPVTKTVVAEAIREAVKAGVPLQRFLEIWCMRGSRGLQASWIRADERGRAPSATTRKHLGFAQKNYREGIETDGSFH